MSISAKALGMMLAIAVASSASAATEPKTRLVACDAGNCLLVTGRRANQASAVAINGHAVSVHGAHKWRAYVPVETLRKWSAPSARTIIVSVGENAREGASAEADLPIGLLGHVENLAMLVVSVK